MVRLYCLSNCLRINPDKNNTKITPYENGAAETINLYQADTAQIIKEKQYILEFYELTEISIGYIHFLDRKMYLMNIYRKDIGLIQIKMIRGAVRFEKVDTAIFELYIDTSKLFLNEFFFDLQMRIRHIKNTKVKGLISKEEEIYYEKFAKEIKAFCTHQRGEEFYIFPNIREAAFDVLNFNLENTTRPNVLRQKLSDFKRLINLLCDPKTGSYRNVPMDERFNQKLNCLLMQSVKWRTTTPRRDTLSKEAKYHRESKIMELVDANLSKLDLNNVDLNSKEAIHFYKVNIFNHKNEIHPAFRNYDFRDLKKLELISCNLKEVSDAFINLLPVTIQDLRLQDNDITSITDSISNLTNLLQTNLRGNKNLCDLGIPWPNLPINLIDLNLRETNITKIPEEIQRLKALRTLRISSPILHHIAWDKISPMIEEITIDAGKNLNAMNLSDNTKLSELYIREAGITTLDYPQLQNIFSGYFQGERLSILILEDNNLLSIEWELLPAVLTMINFDKNQIKYVGNISHIFHLDTLSLKFNEISCISEHIWILKELETIDLEDNHLSYLPKGFETLESLKHFNLAQNRFNYDTVDLDECLWNRLPMNLFRFTIDDNNLRKLPCSLKFYDIAHLHANRCELIYICPHLYMENRTSDQYRHLYIEQNPVQYLPFIPKTIFHPPKKEDLSDESNVFKGFYITSDNEKLIYCLTFPTKYGKPIYNFRISKDPESPFACQCCANCGQETNQKAVEQIIVPDFTFQLKTIKKLREKKNQKDNKIAAKSNSLSDVYFDSVEVGNEQEHSSEIIETDSQETFMDMPIISTKYYLPGKWKTIAKTRLCRECLQNIKKRTDNAYIEHVRNQEEESILMKKKRENVEQPIITESSEISSEILNEEFGSDITNADMIQYPTVFFKNFVPEADIVVRNEVYKTKSYTITQKASADEITRYQKYYNEKLDLLKPTFQWLGLKDSDDIDSFLIAAVNGIDSMEKLKKAICNFSRNNSVNATHLELTKVLQEETSDVQALRHTLHLFDHYKQAVPTSALFTILASLDDQSRQLVQYEYDDIESCLCGTKVVSSANICTFLSLTAKAKKNYTFDALISEWSKFKSRSCESCRNDVFTERRVKWGEFQQYHIAELNMNEQSEANSTISWENFNVKSQPIFNASWKLICAVEYNAYEDKYLAWREYESEWCVVESTHCWTENQLKPNLENYKMLIFKRWVFPHPNLPMPQNSTDIAMPHQNQFQNPITSYDNLQTYYSQPSYPLSNPNFYDYSQPHQNNNPILHSFYPQHITTFENNENTMFSPNQQHIPFAGSNAMQSSQAVATSSQTNLNAATQGITKELTHDETLSLTDLDLFTFDAD